MDWKVFLTIFLAIFLAELADKTQFVGIGMSARSGKPISVWVGSVCAYMIVTAISVVLGATLGKFIRSEVIRYIGSLLFVVIVFLMFLGKV